MPDIKLITANLADALIPGIERASGIYILTSFVMESGVKLLQPYLKAAAERGAEIRVLAGDYLFVTQPQALRRLLAIDGRIEARLWRSYGTSFHPKAYLLDYNDGQGLMIVGSSNLSLSAFRLGYEWNLAVNAQAEPYTFQEALMQFNRSFFHEQTFPLNAETLGLYETDYERHHRQYPELVRIVSEMEETELMMPVKPAGAADDDAEAGDGRAAAAAIAPRPAQQAALDALNATWEEGYDRAMVVMATGLGKTYLAAFFARPFRRVLFVAHREEILHQAQRSFRHVMPGRSAGLYNGAEKETEAELIFASIFTLGMKKHRERFAPDAFDLIVVDEFHHAAARSYATMLRYFRPGFMLGITATPERMDGKDVYALCDGNVAYQIHFIEAIGRGWLCPFQYYGVYDDTDYSRLAWVGNRYDEEQLLAAQLREDRAALALSGWTKHKRSRSLGFCSSIRQADYLAGYFRDRGYRTLSLHSRTTEMSRAEAIGALERGELDIVFTVDLFNEGVDIPSVDTLLFVRPTESLTVYTQQVGRGLRLSPGKPFCVIIDLIGNYRNADLKLGLFGATGTEEEAGHPPGRSAPTAAVTAAMPPGCSMELELGVVDLLRELLGKKQPRRERLRSAYLELKRELGRRPTYLELHLHGQAPSREIRQEFGSYAGFLSWADELSASEQLIFRQSEPWLREVESTAMSKSYKMVLLLAMLERGPERWGEPIAPAAAAPFFHRYLTEKEYRRKIDLSDGETGRLAERYDGKRTASLIARMPMTKWSGSSKGMIAFADGEFRLPDFPHGAATVYEWTREVCLYRLHVYFERRG